MFDSLYPYDVDLYVYIEKTLKKIMPQLVPFYYMNEIIFSFSLIIIILYILSKFILPRILRLFVSRMFINKI